MVTVLMNVKAKDMFQSIRSSFYTVYTPVDRIWFVEIG
jgi:hypothetical protein